MEQLDLLSKVSQVLNIKTLQTRVNQAPKLTRFSYSMVDGKNRIILQSKSFAVIREKERGAELAFELSLDLLLQHSLLKALQGIGFDIYQLVSMPKGEKYNIVHDNISQLNRFLSGQDIPEVIRFPALKNKLISPSIGRYGRLHVRFYDHESDSTKLIATAHIDPPNLNHINILKHLRDEVDVDYKKGTELFQRVLEFIQRD